MRSRYTSYALGRIDHIIDTTHPAGPMWEADRERWAARIRLFSDDHTFEGLDVLAAATETPDRGRVLFRAHIAGRDGDVSFAENSLFLRHEGRWLYHSGEPG